MSFVAVRVCDDPILTVAGREGGSDVPVINQIWAGRVYDPRGLRRWPDLQAQLNALTARGKRPLVIDAGANIGASALFFATFFPNSHVVAVEPEAGNFALLAHNASQHPAITCVHGAIASQRGRFAVLDAQSGAVGFRAAEAGETLPEGVTATGESVDALSVYDLLALGPPDAEPFMIKIDIEGGEKDLFAKNTSWIDLFPLIVVELHDWMLPGCGNSRNFLCAIAATGRDFVQVGENIFSIRN